MITEQELLNVQIELLRVFPEVENIDTKAEGKRELNAEKFDYKTFCLYMSKGKKVILKFSKEYLEQNNFDDFKKHLQRNIYYVTKSNINKTIYLLKNFEIEIEEVSYV